MKSGASPRCIWMEAGGVAMALFLTATTARANVYATDIQLNGSLASINAPVGNAVSITYRLNQAAIAGVTVNILQGNTVVATMSGGTSMALNSVSWTPLTAGTYSVSITAGATGFPIWTQISVDANAGMPAYYPLGIDVDKNTSSPYYGRVIMGCAIHNGSDPVVPAAAQMTGLYKMNADGSQADEGWYGNAGYANDDAGDPPVPGQMPDSDGNNPFIIRIGDDDRIYWCDNSALGAIVACDMQATTNQTVINEEGYDGNPDYSHLAVGIQQFDVTGTGTGKGAIWLCDIDTLNWGVWMYHMAGGMADPRDTEGTQAVFAGASSDLRLGSSGGCMIDANLDIFVSQNCSSGSPAFRTMEYPAWNGGVLPPEAGGFNYAEGRATGQVVWGAGASDNTFCGVRDTVINSRTQPTMVALPMALDAGGDNTVYGIRVLNTADGSVVSATNGAAVQSLTNLDFLHQYTCAAWDNVGNLYGASPTPLYRWRVWSPPGPNTATTAAVARIVVPTAFAITSVTASPGSFGCAIVTITFTAPGNLDPPAFTLMGAATVNGAYTPVAGASVTGGAGVYQATATVCSSAQFFEIGQN